ncbi:MAG: hypothetical protein DMG42_26445 [Acidobacteria bacterium]|nr:MAG: hypothetical protein DMG42_26445 [Acidobacteriota bacterium]
MSPFENKTTCKDIAPLLVFYVCEEVSEDERESIRMHLANCRACSEQLAEEKAFHATLLSAPQSADELDGSGILLSQCRSELEEALDDLSAPPLQEHWRPFGWLRGWMALRPVWSGALLVLVGGLAGVQLVPWLEHNSGNTGQADSNVRQVLTYMVENSERFDAGVRLDCLDALKAVVRDQQVRLALLNAARKDQNPAVRMKALEALRDTAGEDDVRQVLVDALEHDSNPGVRVEAVNLLVGSLDNRPADADAAPETPEAAPAPAPGEDASFEHVVRVLQELQRRDPNPYVRLRSAAALRQIGPREMQ